MATKMPIMENFRLANGLRDITITAHEKATKADIGKASMIERGMGVETKKEGKS